MLLTCPNCRSGLEVPDGTTAMVRCPACKTIFSPAAGLSSPEPEPEEERPRRPARRHEKDEEEDDRGRSRRRRDDYEDEEYDDRPRRRRRDDRDEDEEEDEDDRRSKNRDFDPPDPDDRPRKRRRKVEDDDLTPEERESLKRAFARAALGARLISVSLLLFMTSMMMIIGLWFRAAITPSELPGYGFILAAGVLGAVNWLLAAVGVGLCLSGPPSPGHWGYGIAAAATAGVHLVLLIVLVGQGKEYSPGKIADPDGGGAKWGLVPTRMDAFTFYLTFLLYREQDLIPKAQMNLSIVVGVFEVLRTMFILMLLSCLARSAGDDDLSGKCTRAAGAATFGPGVLAVCMLVFVALMVELNLSSGTTGRILFSTVQMGIYAILNGTIFPGWMASREVADACEEPFQSKIPQL